MSWDDTKEECPDPPNCTAIQKIPHTEWNAMVTDQKARILKTLFDAYSILYADTDNTPAALTVVASRFIGRKAAGGIAAMTVAEAKTLLAVVKADISDFSHSIEQHTNVARKKFIPATGGYTTGGLTIYGDSMPVVSLDKDADEQINVSFIIPDDYASGGVIKIVYLEWNIGSGDVVWDCALSHAQKDEAFNTNTSSDNTNVTPIAANQQYKELTTSVAFTSPAKGEYVTVKVKRDADNGSDTYNADWLIVGVIFEYTAEQ